MYTKYPLIFVSPSVNSFIYHCIESTDFAVFLQNLGIFMQAEEVADKSWRKVGTRATWILFRVSVVPD